jgi:hypothetical protein
VVYFCAVSGLILVYIFRALVRRPSGRACGGKVAPSIDPRAMALWPRPYAAADPPLRLRPASGDAGRVPRETLRSRSPRLHGPAGSTTTASRPSFTSPTLRPSAVRAPTTANYYEYSGDPFFQERVEALFSWIADADTPTELYHVPLMRQTAERLVSIGLCSPAALAGASWEEVLYRWDSA